MKKLYFLFILLSLCLSCASGGGVQTTEEKSKGIQYSTIIIQHFSLESTAIQENDDVKVFAKSLPPQFADVVKNHLEVMNLFKNVIIEKPGERVEPSEDAVILEGRFTKITAGSTAARMLVGFGAGSSTVGAIWTLKDAKTGKELETFERRRHTSRSARGIPSIQSDSTFLAKDVAVTIKRFFNK